MNKGPTPHITDSELLQSADGELSSQRTAHIHEHLAECGSCRSRSMEFESIISDFVQGYEHDDAKLPAIEETREAARFRLGLGLAQLAANTRASVWERASGFLFAGRRWAYAGGAFALVLLYFIAVRVSTPPAHGALIPNSRLTPGVARSVAREEICSSGNADTSQAVPSTVVHRVFEEYGIRNPAPRRYEVDYLISPALGGSADIQNLWPQPYTEGTWNSHVKDALEDRLHVLVCAGLLDLSIAQRDISADWIAAYRKYFRTREPLEIHAGFALDPPWE